MESTYSCSSVVGLVSSKRRLNFPPYLTASPKLRQIDFACPICSSLGSGGNRVCTCPPNRPVLLCSSTTSWMKFRLGASDLSSGLFEPVPLLFAMAFSTNFGSERSWSGSRLFVTVVRVELIRAPQSERQRAEKGARPDIGARRDNLQNLVKERRHRATGVGEVFDALLL